MSATDPKGDTMEATKNSYTPAQARRYVGIVAGLSPAATDELVEHMVATGDCVMHALYERGFGDRCGCAPCQDERQDESVVEQLGERARAAVEASDYRKAGRIVGTLVKVADHWDGIVERRPHLSESDLYQRTGRRARGLAAEVIERAGELAGQEAERKVAERWAAMSAEERRQAIVEMGGYVKPNPAETSVEIERNVNRAMRRRSLDGRPTGSGTAHGPGSLR